jgi:hypothetical protein
MRRAARDRQATTDGGGWRAGHNGGDADLCRDLSVGDCASFSGGSPHLSVIAWQTLAISARTSNTTRSAADRKITTRRAPRGQARQCRQGDTGHAVDRFFSIRRNRSNSVLTAT